MEAGAEAGMNARVLKEPRGFIRIVQFVLTIFAFATTGGWSTDFTFTVTCNATTKATKAITRTIAYPFVLEDVTVETPICAAKQNVTNHFLYGGMKSSAEFYVFVGVVVFLYCLAAVILYIFFDRVYRKRTIVPLIDFVVTVVFTLLWLISSAAWAAGLQDLKDNTHIDNFKNDIEDCKIHTCKMSDDPDFATLNVSVIFGFLNMVVWASSLWFLWKETSWFKQREAPASESVPGAGEPSQPTPQI